MKFHPRIQLGLALASVALVAACQNPAGHADGELEMTELAGGPHSGIVEPGVRVARNSDEWAELWAAHAATSVPAPPAPAVDFETDMVVAVFLGQRSSAGYDVVVLACRMEDGQLRVQAREVQPDPALAQATVMTSPFRFVGVRRVGGDVDLDFEGDR